MLDIFNFVDKWGETSYDPYAFKTYLANNRDIVLYVCFLYLMFVFYSPPYLKKIMGEPKTPQNDKMVKLVKFISVFWNLLLSAFALYGTSRVFPPLVENFQKYGLHDTLCTFRPEQFYTTPIGTALGLFTMSKVPEFGDTVFLLLFGKKLPFLQYFHHTTMFLFVWHAYEQGSSIFITAAALNYFVHTIMYFYFAMDSAGLKNLVKPFGMYITMLQLIQMMGVMASSSYVMYHKFFIDAPNGIPADAEGQGSCPGTSLYNARLQFCIYTFFLYLFGQMFINNYVRPKPRPAAGAKKQA
ncbi:fatty acid elongase [Angomonas deanei]|uniref:Elongation of fatty acids protein n=1 Tax=Angomonas deanei TaxID=59799 RepID=S9UD16_9TRYP|nr:fatty acid elongase [Angomonas deanei]EPY29952.1 fatty acid elongase [Angomonas deanei]CAD2219298.1 GNS1/SUR4 family, putative [Angomonas deanei]|eukprot:EPY26828.1 fatty acid elongase [Angomonas deanei]